MARKVAAALGGTLRGKTIAVLGLTFKPNTDDMREAPSIPLITALTGHGRAGARLRSGRHGAGARKLIGGIEFASGPYACAEGADALVIVTEWEQFRALDFERLRNGDETAGPGRPAQRLPARRRSRASPITASGAPATRRITPRPDCRFPVVISCYGGTFRLRGGYTGKVLQARVFMSLLETSHENAGDDAGWRDALTAIRSGLRDAPPRWESIFGPLRAGWWTTSWWSGRSASRSTAAPRP